MKRTRWKIYEVFNAICLVSRYHSHKENAEYSRKRLFNETEAKRWDGNAENALRELEIMGLAEIIPDIKRVTS